MITDTGIKQDPSKLLSQAHPLWLRLKQDRNVLECSATNGVQLGQEAHDLC